MLGRGIVSKVQIYKTGFRLRQGKKAILYSTVDERTWCKHEITHDVSTVSQKHKISVDRIEEGWLV